MFKVEKESTSLNPLHVDWSNPDRNARSLLTPTCGGASHLQDLDDRILEKDQLNTILTSKSTGLPPQSQGVYSQLSGGLICRENDLGHYICIQNNLLTYVNHGKINMDGLFS